MYWRDVGTIDAYYDANMDLRQVSPVLNLYNRPWPLRTAGYSDAPAKLRLTKKGSRGQAIDSIVAGGSHLVGRRREALGVGPRRSRAYRRLLKIPIIFDNCDIGRRAKSGGDPRQECPGSGRCNHRVRSWRRTRSIIMSPKAGIVVVEGHRSTVEVGSIDTRTRRRRGAALLALRRRALTGGAALQ